MFRCPVDVIAALQREGGRPHDKTVRFAHFVVWDEPLKVPGGVRPPATCGRLRKPDPVAGAEHQHVRHAVTDPVIPRFGVDVLGAVVDQRQRELWIDLQVRQPTGGRMRAVDAMPRRDPANPVGTGVGIRPGPLKKMDRSIGRLI